MAKRENFEKVEALLYEYPELSSEVVLRLLDHPEGPPITAFDYTRARTSPTNKFFSTVESSAFKFVGMDAELTKKLKKKRQIETALSCLSDRQYKVIWYRYFRKMSWIEIAVEMSYDTSTVYRYRKQAIKKLLEVGLLDVIAKNQKNVS